MAYLQYLAVYRIPSPLKGILWDFFYVQAVERTPNKFHLSLSHI